MISEQGTQCPEGVLTGAEIPALVTTVTSTSYNTFASNEPNTDSEPLVDTVSPVLVTLLGSRVALRRVPVGDTTAML